RVGTRAGHDLGAEGFHEDATVRFLMVGDLHHVDLALQPEEAARLRQRGAPLTGARLRGQTRDLLLLVVVGLRYRGVRAVTAGGTHALVLVVDPRRRVERLLEAAGAIERRGPPETIDVAHLIGDLDPAILTDLLLDQFHREERREVLWPDRLSGSGM